MDNLWNLHRQRILRLGGLLLFGVAIAWVLADGSVSEGGGYETGRLLGTATRNVVLSVIAATLGVYAVRRFYQHQEGASWKEITPEATAIAGVLSVVLAVAIGAPDTPAEEARESTLAAIDDCAEKSPAVTAHLPGDSIELSAAEILEVNPQLAASPPELRDAARMYVWHSKGVPFLLSTFPIPADRVGDQTVLQEYFGGFDETMPPGQARRAGITGDPIAGRPAYQVAFRGGNTRFIAALDGCHVVTLEANSVETNAVMTGLLAGTVARS